MFKQSRNFVRMLLFAGFLPGGIVVSTAAAQLPASPQGVGKPVSQPGQHLLAAAPSRHRPDRFAGRAGQYYRLVWGVDTLTVKWTESGEVIRFSYRVLDPAKAAQLNDKKAEPALYDPKAGVKLVVPQMEKVGLLRQTSTPAAGRSYWMAFSNKGRHVMPGDLVVVEIGQFHAVNLMVE